MVAEGGGIEPPSTSFPERWFFGTRKALPSLRALRWSESRELEPDKSGFADRCLDHFGISHMAHPRGIERRIAVLEAATVAVRSGGRSVGPMGVRFQRRVKLFLGCHLNLSGSGVEVSFGGRGAHVGISSRGRRYVSASIPGTRLSEGAAGALRDVPGRAFPHPGLASFRNVRSCGCSLVAADSGPLIVLDVPRVTAPLLKSAPLPTPTAASTSVLSRARVRKDGAL